VPKSIQIGSVTQALQRAFGFKGRYTPMLDEVIVPVWVVQDPAPAVKTRLAMGVSDRASLGAGTTPDHVHSFLWNPPESGVMAVVNSVRLQLSLGDDKAIIDAFEMIGKIVVTDTRPSGTPVPGVFRDTRLSGTPSLELLTLVDQVPPATPHIAEFLFIGGLVGAPAQDLFVQSSDPRQPLVMLAPGAYLETANFNPTDDSQTGPVALLRVRTNWQWLEVPITEQDPVGGLPGT